MEEQEFKDLRPIDDASAIDQIPVDELELEAGAADDGCACGCAACGCGGESSGETLSLTTYIRSEEKEFLIGGKYKYKGKFKVTFSASYDKKNKYMNLSDVEFTFYIVGMTVGTGSSTKTVGSNSENKNGSITSGLSSSSASKDVTVSISPQYNGASKITIACSGSLQVNVENDKLVANAGTISCSAKE